ncbi:hypothetical protein HG530_011838 [Fusarium avenaceum]|nr:hypothetical protein HG530_011838 [Fusarium avenaceum]
MLAHLFSAKILHAFGIISNSPHHIGRTGDRLRSKFFHMGWCQQISVFGWKPIAFVSIRGHEDHEISFEGVLVKVIELAPQIPLLMVVMVWVIWMMVGEFVHDWFSNLVDVLSDPVMSIFAYQIIMSSYVRVPKASYRNFLICAVCRVFSSLGVQGLLVYPQVVPYQVKVSAPASVFQTMEPGAVFLRPDASYHPVQGRSCLLVERSRRPFRSGRFEKINLLGSTSLKRVGDTLAQTLDQVEPISGILLVLGHAVVELEQQECVTVDIGCVAGLGLGNGRVNASCNVHLEPPGVTAALAGGGDVVDEGLELSECEFRSCQATGVEVIMLGPVSYGISLMGLNPINCRGANLDVKLGEQRLKSLAQIRFIANVGSINAVSILGDGNLHGDLCRHSLAKLLKVKQTLSSRVLIPVEANIKVCHFLGRGEGVEFELGYNAERCTSAADGPEEIRVFGL